MLTCCSSAYHLKPQVKACSLVSHLTSQLGELPGLQELGRRLDPKGDNRWVVVREAGVVTIPGQVCRHGAVARPGPVLGGAGGRAGGREGNWVEGVGEAE